MTDICQQLAADHDNAAGLKVWRELSPPLLKYYPIAADQEWKSYDGAKLTGARTDRTWGVPSVVITFGKVSFAEYRLLRGYLGYVTLRCLNEDSGSWGNYNATLRTVTAGDLNKARDGYNSVSLRFIDLEAL